MKLPRWKRNAFASIRAKLIGVFILIKVLPLAFLALFAWWAAEKLAGDVAERTNQMADAMFTTINTVGESVTQDARRALDDRSREALETQTTEIAHDVAAFLYDRDKDILQAASQAPSVSAYQRFLAYRQRELFAHGPWALNSERTRWEPVRKTKDTPIESNAAVIPLPDNARDFNIRAPEYLGEKELRPLYVEMTFIGLDGREKVKVTTGSLTKPTLIDARDRLQTFVKAETYWPNLQELKSGEIYVSDVIGAYVGSRLIGPYLPSAAQKAGLPFAPEQSAYAGLENPVGKRFHGIIRWATPVERSGKRIGYVTLALDHDHLRQFTDRIIPTTKRFTPIANAAEGNYAFMWDHKHRAISHPRDYFIVGYDPETGEPATPWMDQTLYDAWRASGKSSSAFLAGTPSFKEPSLQKRSADALVKQGTVGLDCRYLNFAPQCHGFKQLTENGGSGSFVIYWSGVWKLTTAATIPYFTGQFGHERRGFGYITIGANIDAFHQAATESAQRIASLVVAKENQLQRQRDAINQSIANRLTLTGRQLFSSTAVMVIAVILIAIWMATFLSRRVTVIIDGIRRVQGGNLAYRLEVKSHDELGDLALSINLMADALRDSFSRLSTELAERQRTNELLSIAAIAFEAQEGMVITDENQIVLRVNRAFCQISGYEPNEVIGKKVGLLRSGHYDDDFYAEMWSTIRKTGSWQGEIWDRRKSGEAYPVWLTITAVMREDASVSHYVGTHTDIAKIKAAEDEIRHLAFFDPLTKLPNRRLLMDRLQKAFSARELHGLSGALLFIDLDNFKYLNDTLGHHRGDLLLQQVAERLTACIRESDTVSRLGGDEFVVMLLGLSAVQADAAINAEAVAKKILDSLNRPYKLDGHDHQNTPSIGITLFSQETCEVEELLKQADLAMYEAKAAGRNGLRFFDPGMQAAVAERTSLEAELRIAVRDKKFEIHYQPQVSGRGQLIGTEALLRWPHTERGWISPRDFIPLSEETGLIVPLGYWVLETVCHQLAAWARQHNAEHLSIAVNISARQLRQADFVHQVLAIVDRTGANPHRLKLELTESVFISNVDDAITKMTELKSHGVRFSMDDFGTGFSSLSYLKRLPLDQVKIDRSFVKDMLNNRNDLVIIDTIVALTDNFGMSLIAEGVETEAQRDYLASRGCDEFQGYLFGRPVSIDALHSQWLPSSSGPPSEVADVEAY